MHLWSVCMSLYVHVRSNHEFLAVCVCAHSRVCHSMLPEGQGSEPDPGHSMTLCPDLCCECLNYPSALQKERDRVCMAVDFCVFYLLQTDGFQISTHFFECALLISQALKSKTANHCVLQKPSISSSLLFIFSKTQIPKKFGTWIKQNVIHFSSFWHILNWKHYKDNILINTDFCKYMLIVNLTAAICFKQVGTGATKDWKSPVWNILQVNRFKQMTGSWFSLFSLPKHQIRQPNEWLYTAKFDVVLTPS